MTKKKKELKKKRVGIRPSSKGRRSKSVEEVIGTVSIARDGFGFVMVEGREDDIFIPFGKLRGALNGDTVKAAVLRKNRPGGRKEGEVVQIVERSTRPYIGILSVRGTQAWVITESARMPYDIRIPMESADDLPTIGGIKAENGLKVAAMVTDWPRNSMEPHGKIVDVLGKPGVNTTEMHAILAEFGLPYRFEDDVQKAADSISDKITKSEIARRRDFRKITTFTIDPSDAKDFDDALSFCKLPDGTYEVGVHIADVTHYVTPGDTVDKEGYNRATSVYLVDRTIPMLPENLSNKLCSLRPHEDKLCFAAVFQMNDKGDVLDSWFGRTIINSDYRFDYEQAQDIIENMRGPLATEILTLHSLATILRKKRFAKGAISFERPEMKVEIDKEGKPINVTQKISREANWLIEEFMLLANRSVAEYVTKKLHIKKPPFVYRIHEVPNTEKIGNLRTFAKNFGYELGATETTKQTSKSLNALLKEVKDTPQGAAIEMLALRSMARARYSTDNVGHYGLAFPFYTHFTSPIRRYPDMMVHRLLAGYLKMEEELVLATQNESKKRRNSVELPNKQMYEEFCQYCSTREQIATDAERASIKYKLVEFMQDKIGVEFDGTISGLTDWGIYVEIEPTKIEGMISIREIKGDYFSFDEERYLMVSKATGRTYTLGDKVRIRVLRANLEQKLLDYELVL